jgi:carbon monoxide dehydrogenase subunit G
MGILFGGIMIHFEGDQSFPLPVAEVAAKLSDVGFLVGTLPDAQVSEAKPDRGAWKLRPKLAFLSGSLDTVMEATERDPGKAVAFKIFTKAIGASSTVLTRLKFFPTEDGGTAVHWTGDLTEVSGLLKMVPKGLLQGTATKVIDDVWAAVTAKLVPAK